MTEPEEEKNEWTQSQPLSAGVDKKESAFLLSSLGLKGNKASLVLKLSNLSRYLLKAEKYASTNEQTAYIIFRSAARGFLRLHKNTPKLLMVFLPSPTHTHTHIPSEKPVAP